MNATGHERIVELVNRALSGQFPDRELKAGSTDPDTNSSGRSYTGVWSKHHYDNGGPEAGRYHGADTITGIVYHCCVIARQYWLANQGAVAAFEFGVGTHFFMDGFICSPSVDEGAHQTGDSEFSRAARQMKPVPVPRPDERTYCSQYINSQISAIANRFGRTDPADVALAYGALVRLGYAVTAPDVPQTFQERLAAAQDLLDRRLQQEWDKLSQWLAQEPTEPYSNVHALAAKAIGGSCILWIFFAVEQYHRRGQLSRSLASRLFMAMFKRGLISQGEQPFLGDQHQCVEGIEAATTQSCNFAIEWDRQWYKIDASLESHRNRCVQRQSEWTTRARSARNDVQKRIEETLHAWGARWLEEEFPKRWNNSLPDRISCSRATVAMICISSLVTASILGAIASAMHLLLYGLIVAAPFCLAAVFLWRAWSLCVKISACVWRRGEIHCPRCGRTSRIEILPGETRGTCPFCSQASLPIGSTQDR